MIKTANDDIFQMLVDCLKGIDASTVDIVDDQSISKYGCDLYIPSVVLKFLPKPDGYNVPYEEKICFDNEKKQTTATFCDAAWQLCCMGVLRPGGVDGTMNSPDTSWQGQGYSITAFGREWLAKQGDNLLPANPNRYVQVFDKFQNLFGPTYFSRASEAVSCFQRGVYLACCVMCGSAAESILLAAAMQKDDPEKVFKEYHTASGRSRVEKKLFSQVGEHVRQEYKQYTGLMKYWRDEAGHGDKSNIDSNEAFIALTSLLRFAQFMKDAWKLLASKSKLIQKE